MRVLVLDANTDSAGAVAAILRERGALVDPVSRVDDAAYLAADYPIDVIVVAVPEAETRFADTLRRLRHENRRAAILAVFARDAALDRIRALESGADLCLARPSDPREIVECASSLYRRGLGFANNVISIGPLCVDITSWDVRIGGRTVDLTPRARKIFGLLALQRGSRLSREDLHERVNGPDSDADPKVIDVHICHIRKLLREGFPGLPVRIETFSHHGWALMTDLPESEAVYLSTRFGRSRRRRPGSPQVEAA